MPSSLAHSLEEVLIRWWCRLNGSECKGRSIFESVSVCHFKPADFKAQPHGNAWILTAFMNKRFLGESAQVWVSRDGMPTGRAQWGRTWWRSAWHMWLEWGVWREWAGGEFSKVGWRQASEPWGTFSSQWGLTCQPQPWSWELLSKGADAPSMRPMEEAR
jgi:hypothetical protein